MPRFSIITITKDNAKGVQDTYASITLQTYTDYEWIVIDGGSDVKTASFMIDRKAVYQRARDKGLYDAMNKGIALANGDYIIFLNAGDRLAAPDVLETLARYDGDFIYGDAIEDNHTKHARPHHDIKRCMFTHHQAMVYSTAILKTMRYDLQYRIAADYDLTVRFLSKASMVHAIQKPICIFETGGLSQRQTGKGRTEQFKIREFHETVPFMNNVHIYFKQMAAQILRSTAPNFYWRVRSWRNTRRADTRAKPRRDRPKSRT